MAGLHEEVQQVWAHNFDREIKLIESLLPRFRYVAVDTEFPGTVHEPALPSYMLSAERRFSLLKANVDELELIQLGLMMFDMGCRLPDLCGATRYVREFNFREFDVRRPRHAPESIAMLRNKGVDFDLTHEDGIDAAVFGPRLRKWLRAGVITFSGGYDLAYMVKMMFGAGYKLLATAVEFERVAKVLLQRKLFDVKEMARYCPSDLRGRLESIVGKLKVARAVREVH
ncbi:probable CCR4-associated factor 1 homolog 9 [Phragmites australis]|uniref:probable CCR4-associated factor 1 homolog 9 n=1 Tax=Phragmites australis TaxID=29695 RepID=UPI002D784097|nr:probable CCR4-associated factor 1 homolog 9 [Phragmites australis]